MSHHKLVLASLFAIVCTATGCVTESNYDETRDEVINGFLDTTRQAVYIQTIRGGQAFSCTGALIDDHTVLTAAHCLDGSVERVLVATGQLAYSPDQVIEARTWAIDTRYNRNAPGFDKHLFDVGIIRLSRGAGVGALPLDIGGVSAAAGTPIKMIGYGSEDRRSASLPILGVGGGLIFARQGLFAQGSEGGDSGGPALLDGRIRAVTSGGGRRSDTGELVTVFTELAPSGDFISWARQR